LKDFESFTFGTSRDGSFSQGLSDFTNFLGIVLVTSSTSGVGSLYLNLKCFRNFLEAITSSVSWLTSLSLDFLGFNNLLSLSIFLGLKFFCFGFSINRSLSFDLNSLKNFLGLGIL
jgi:hypothetical protein